MNVRKLAISDGVLGFWAALEEIYPQSRRCTRSGRSRPGRVRRGSLICSSRLIPKYPQGCTVRGEGLR